VGIFIIREERVDREVSVVLVDGYLDFDAAPALKESIVNQLDEGTRHLIVDLTQTEFIDSTAIGVLVGGLKRVQESGGTLAVVCTNANIRDIFALVGLDDMLPLHRSRDDALSAIASTA